MKKYAILLCAAAALFLGSCYMLLPPKEDDPDLKKFWAIDFTKNPRQQGYFYQVKAQQLYDGDNCVIFAETTAGISAAAAERFALEYSENIYGVMLDYFCERNFEVDYYGTKTTYADTLEYAYSLVENQDKLIILLLDIKDGYRPGGGYIAGYFDPRNLYYGANSNFKNMIYVDTNPGRDNQEEMYSTFAHELQHLINYVTSLLRRSRAMDIWIDEGLSLMAEHLYQKKPLASRIQWFIEDKLGTIAYGNNFYIWDNYSRFSDDTVLDDYATAYLFFQWLSLQAGEEAPSLLREIVTSGNYDYRAVIENTASIITDGDNWEVLLRTWLAANCINEPTNQYGYKGNAAFEDIAVKTFPATDDNENNEIELFPGEGVYSTINSAFELPADDSGIHIRYAGLQTDAPFINTSGSPYTGDFLLTFNIKTEGAALESGYFTGEDAPAVARAVERAVTNFPYPLRIDARDLMRRNNAPTQTESVPLKAGLSAHEH